MKYEFKYLLTVCLLNGLTLGALSSVSGFTVDWGNPYHWLLTFLTAAGWFTLGRAFGLDPDSRKLARLREENNEDA